MGNLKNNNNKMATEIKKELTENEIKFVEEMEQYVLPHRNSVASIPGGITKLISVGKLVNIMITPGCCPGRAPNGTQDLLNLYGQLKPKYDEYIKNKPVVYTKYEAVIKDEEEKDGFTIDEPNVELRKKRPTIKLRDKEI